MWTTAPPLGRPVALEHRCTIRTGMYRCSNALTVFQCLRRRRALPGECFRRRRALPGEELLEQAPCLAAALLLTGALALVAATTAVPTVVVPIVIAGGDS